MKTKLKRYNTRPRGISSRLHKVPGPKTRWLAANGESVELPIEVDILNIDEATGELLWLVLAKVELVESEPALVSMELQGSPSLDPTYLQRFFRWRTPLDIVMRVMPHNLSQGINPYACDYPIDGYPDAANIASSANQRLSDEFLKDIAIKYKKIGRGYAKEIALQRGVSTRTVVSWIEKARKRGLLPPTQSGKPSFRD